MTRCPKCGRIANHVNYDDDRKIVSCDYCELLANRSGQMANYTSRSDEIDESYLSRKWHFEH